MTELYPAGEAKKPWQSKTLWANLLMSIGAFIPAIQPFVTTESLAAVFTVVNIILRFTTKSGISIK